MSPILEANKCRRLLAGTWVASPSPGEEVVISGISGRFPNSDNIDDFMKNLLNKVDLCDDDNRRWEHTHPEIPKINGKINGITSFDAGFFGVHKFHANFTDPQGRLLLERCVEAVMDAGINPVDLKGSKTGVFVGSCYSDIEKRCYFEKFDKQGCAVPGCTRSMLAQRISYCLQLNGPSMICDTACSSGLYGFEMAYRYIREGKCDQAIVGGSNLCFDPYLTLQFARLGILNINTGCRPFDQNAYGYTRSEAISILFLQKQKDSKRIYAKIVHSKTNSDGFKEKGITHPSSEAQIALLKDVYEECDISQYSLGFIEAHGTGTKVGDPEELNALDKFYCAQRQEPLLVGSVKGNIGHSEPVSGLCSITKVIFGMETGTIPPNIHCENPRQDVEALKKNRIQIVTEPTPWPDYSSLGAVNGFGFGGANCHVILERHNKLKKLTRDNLPRLVCVSGRSLEGVYYIQDFLQNHRDDNEVISLIHDIYKKDLPNTIYRGFSILNSNGELLSSSNYYEGIKKPLYVCIGNANVCNVDVLKSFMEFQEVQKTIQTVEQILLQSDKKIDLWNISSSKIQEAMITMCIQIVIINLLKLLDISYDYIRSYSMGDFISAYANNTLSLSEVVLLTYSINEILETTKNEESLLNVLKNLIQPAGRDQNKMQTPKTNKNAYGTPEYFLFNILNLNCKDYEVIPRNAMVLTLNCNKNVIKNPCIELTSPEMKVETFLYTVGKLYEVGHQPQVQNLYPDVQWPVSRGTPMISSLIKWKHNDSYFVPLRNHANSIKDGEKMLLMGLMNSDHLFYKGHVIDGRNLFPATGYLFAIWEFYADIKGLLYECTSVCFEGVVFHRAITIGKKNEVNIYLSITKTGYFEVSEGNSLLVNGHIRIIKNDQQFEDVNYEEDKNKLMKKDIYKKLKLRGYNYKGPFQLIQEMSGKSALIQWTENYVTFIDNMLQILILQKESSFLYVPTGIDRLVINAKEHSDSIKDKEDKNVPVNVDLEAQIVRTKYIEITGLKASVVARKHQTAQPILEVYKFIPNNYATTIEESIRINMQIILETKLVKEIKVLEIIEESCELQPFADHINNALGDLPLIQPMISIYSEIPLEIEHKAIRVQSLSEFQLKNENGVNNLCVGAEFIQQKERFQYLAKTITPDGFMISIESAKINENEIEEFSIITTHKINNKIIYLLRKKLIKKEPLLINISDINQINRWLPELQSKLKSHENIVVYSQFNDLNGILGFINCIRREPNGDHVTCVFLQSKATIFSIKNQIYKTQLDKGMAINVFSNNEWGTYRHTILPEAKHAQSKHWTISMKTKGDLSTLQWTQGHIVHDNLQSNDNLIHVHYCALNFRDVMLATGKLASDAVGKNSKILEKVMGFEFSGILPSGEKIMGTVQGGALSNLIQINELTPMIWNIPSYWSLEDAATIPVVYSTVVYALKEQAFISKGQSILIHSGTGGIGQAAINVCTYFKLNIFITVGTDEKKKFLLKNYPQLKASHIGNSRDTSFEQMIYKETKGRGVDVVLNSLAEEKLHASVRCLAKGGTFIEIGKYDIAKNSAILVDLAAKGCKFYGTMLDSMLESGVKTKMLIQNGLDEGLNKGYIRPLIRTVFKVDQLENAFRYMTTGKHIGKVLIKVQDDECTTIPGITQSICVPRFNCNQAASYVILGGLGGFGLELADWLIVRGAKTLILSSRKGIQDGYQYMKIKTWETLGVKIIISTEDITTYEGCENLITLGNTSAPISGIFNLAVVLKDGILDNQNVESFNISLNPKARATAYLDEISRKLCPHLDYFVVFSSVSCGRGNAGQTNYGFSNSIMERICERRKRDGFPALAIQWGAVGDVGLVAELQKDHSEIAIGGTLQQRISSCLEVMDKFLQQNETIVSSMVVAEKSGMGSADNLVDAVITIMSLKDLKTISLHSTLPELGMDSMMAVEIKQTLESEFDIFLSVQDMRTLTFARLLELNDSSASDPAIKEIGVQNTFKLLLQKYNFNNNIIDKPIIDLCLNNNNQVEKEVIIFPGIDENIASLQKLTESLQVNVKCIQYSDIDNGNGMIFSNVDYILPHLKKCLCRNNSFNILAHSFGSIIGLEIALRLEQEGYVGKIVLIDGSPNLMLELFKLFKAETEIELEMSLITYLMTTYMPSENVIKLKDKLLQAKNYDERQKIAAENLPEDTTTHKKELLEFGTKLHNKIKSLLTYSPNFAQKLKSKILLCKPNIPTISNIPEDYHLSNYFENKVEILNFEGNHQSILENEKLFQVVTKYFDSN